MPARAVCAATRKIMHLLTFSDLRLAAPILKALAVKGYATPTPIQAQAIPCVLAGKDLLGIAQTGTGKTAAFALPILDHLAKSTRPPKRHTCRALILSPTRELSGQILDSFRAYGRHVRIQSALAIGGVSMGAQVRSLLNGLDVLVATPGRLLDLIQSNALRLSGVEVFVLDEADRMLDMGFIRDIRKIVAKLPAQRLRAEPGATERRLSSRGRDAARPARCTRPGAHRIPGRPTRHTRSRTRTADTRPRRGDDPSRCGRRRPARAAGRRRRGSPSSRSPRRPAAWP